ncbi:MAG: response regulator [Planctomycetes bacterium]|nr:response regulator [Planctomycetota bacterium]
MEPKAKVLVVDDENVVCASLNRVLSEDGYSVDTAHNGYSALQRIEEEPFDIAFVDLRMPGMDGLEVLRRIRKRHPQTQVVIVTGYGTPEAENEATALGVCDFLAKPLSPEVITRVAERAWEKRRAVEVTETAGTPVRVTIHPSLRPQAEPPRPSMAKTLGLVVGGPLLGLAFVIFLPVIGLGMLAWILGRKVTGFLLGTKVD